MDNSLDQNSFRDQTDQKFAGFMGTLIDLGLTSHNDATSSRKNSWLSQKIVVVTKWRGCLWLINGHH